MIKKVVPMVAVIAATVAGAGIFSCTNGDDSIIGEGGGIVSDELVSGVFSVSKTKKVQFAGGNLYCVRNSSGSFSFYNEKLQCDYHTRPGVNIAVVDGKEIINPDNASGLFVWDVENAKQGSDYGAFVEKYRVVGKKEDVLSWNEAMGDDWECLNADEWDYVLDGDRGVKKKEDDKNDEKSKNFKNSSYKMIRCGNMTIDVFCIYPDNYQGDRNEITLSDIHEKGIVILPRTGRFSGDAGTNIQGKDLFYWTSSVSPEESSTSAMLIERCNRIYKNGKIATEEEIKTYRTLSEEDRLAQGFSKENGVFPSNYSRYVGCAVRLVKKYNNN